MLQAITITHLQLRNFFCYLLLAAAIYSAFLLSVSMIALVVLSIVKLEVREGKIALPLNISGWKRALNIIAIPSFAVLSLFFLLAVFRFYPIGDSSYLLTRLRIKVPFLVLPFVFLALPRFSKQDMQRFFYFFLIMITATSLGVIINYLLDYEHYNELIKQGQHIPSPRDHIRYSLFAALSVIGGIYLYTQKFVLRHQWEHQLILGLTVFVFLFIHFFSVKSGLVVLYGSLFFGLAQYMVHHQKYLVSIIGLAILLSIPVFAYQMLPTFRGKVQYFSYDMFMYERGEGANHSDSGRLASLDAGWEITKKNWLWGVGTANIRAEVDQFFQEKYPDYPEVLMPQNQFLFSWAATGIFGVLLTAFAFFYPVFYRKNYQHWFFLNFTFSIFIIIMIEHAFENSVGVAHYLFFQLLFLSVINRGGE
jgi:hypothetical protein